MTIYYYYYLCNYVYQLCTHKRQSLYEVLTRSQGNLVTAKIVAGQLMCGKNLLQGTTGHSIKSVRRCMVMIVTFICMYMVNLAVVTRPAQLLADLIELRRFSFRGLRLGLISVAIDWLLLRMRL